MNFGPTLFCSPFYFYYIVPSEIPPSYEIPAIQKYADSSISSAETYPAGVAQEDRIIILKDDLLQQGYELTKKAWTEEQDQLLLKLCSAKNSCFDEIAKLMPHRNAKMCYSRYRRLINQSKDCWSKAQNQKLRACVEQYGLSNWKAFSQYFPNRNYKQLKDHYENFLKPNLVNKEWTVEEDLLLIKLINLHGKNWKLIQSIMFERSRNQLKNRYFGRIKRINDKKVQSLKRDNTPGNKLSLSHL